MRKRGNQKESRKKVERAGYLIVMVLAILMAAGSVEAKNKKYGIFVGINDYPGEDNDLYGAVNDAENMSELLITKFKFARANTTMLLDDKATRDAILNQIKAYGKLVGPGDELVFQYSGHGTLWPDKYSDVMDETEKTEVDITFSDGERYQVPLDFYDSAIVPYDADSKASGKPWGGLILDDEFYTLFSAITKKGATVVFISDSCHSGSVGKGETKGAKFRFISPEKALKVKTLADLNLKRPANQKTSKSQNYNGYYTALTAAKDSEVAMDASGGTVPNGLFTATLIRMISISTTPMTYGRLMSLVEPRVAKTSMDKFSNNQHPQLDRRFGNANTLLFEPVQKRP